ncbi:MAG: putative K(+)-stimulated pyrophosphate-energized sodium pump [Myxococcota bacterium]|nr:putative K(+)-stimulated pyrophosphate-energized sodium pump [Myxococcota bacterium]
MDTNILTMIIPGFAVVGLLYAFWRAGWIARQDAGTDEMKKIAEAISEGAMAFLKQEYKVIAMFVAVVAVLLVISNAGNAQSHWTIAVSFVVGAVMSASSGWFGMKVATKANVRTTSAARTGLPSALQVAFSGGSVMGMTVVGLGLLGLSVLYIIYSKTLFTNLDDLATLARLLQVLSGYSLGASSIALFARVGGGIYTKAADVGADLVGKVEAGIPEDDPRNPAVIADNVGDNVGDVAGMGADLFESYVGAIIGCMVLATTYATSSGTPLNLVLLPMALAGVGIVVSVIFTFFVRTSEGGSPQAALNIGSFGAAGAMAAASYVIIKMMIGDVTFTGDISLTTNGLFMAMVAGLAAGSAIGLLTEYYTSGDKAPVKSVADSCRTGAATNIIAGLGIGMKSTALPVIVLAIGTVMAFKFAGLYGVAIAALGMLSTTGIQLAVDAYGPIADNAGGIAEMAHLDKSVRGRTDKLDAVGNTTAAIGKGFAIGSAALTALALFSAFRTTVETHNKGKLDLTLTDPYVIAGLLIGGMLAFLFSAMAMQAVGRAALSMVEEVRRQFREIKGLMEGTARADYQRCVQISTQAALREMIAPGAMAIAAPVVVGFISTKMLGGLLAGTTVAGVLMALFMANAGGAWDNAKKYIEGGEHGGKGSDAHKAAVVGDTVGDPFKDTAGPAINILIKLMCVVALVIAPLLKIN